MEKPALLNAREARTLSSNSLIFETTDDLLYIMEKIKATTLTGAMSMVIAKVISKETISILQALEYKIEIITRNNITGTVISWGEEEKRGDVDVFVKFFDSRRS